jgi:AcrR family transcriptional regulator
MSPQREFKQRRAAATYEALLAAARRVFAKRGFDAAQTPEIAAEAGVSVGAFYRYFSDKRAAFVEVVQQHLAQAESEVLAKLTPQRFVGSDVRQALDVVIDVLFARVRRDADLERVYLAMSLTDPEVHRLRADFEQNGRTAVATLIAQIIPRSVAPDPESAARVICIAAVELAGDRAGLRPGSEGGSEERIKLQLREMIYRYLFAPSEAVAPAKTRSAVKRARRPRRGR